MEKCPCGSTKEFSSCCEPFLTHKQLPFTPEQLMRSRYTAFAIVNVDYLVATTHPSVRHLHQPIEIKEWAQSNQWISLTIVKTSGDQVHFKAVYQDGKGRLHQHEELSTFSSVEGKWYYVDGEYDF